MSKHRSHRGFSLMELMVVVVIIGIIATIAIPSYTNSVTRSRRAQAASCLQEASQFMERWYTTNLRYDIDAATNAAIVYPVLGCASENKDRKSTCLNSSHIPLSRMPSSA